MVSISVFTFMAIVPNGNLHLVGDCAERAAKQLGIPQKVLCATLGISEQEWARQKWQRGINYSRLTLLGLPFIRTFNELILQTMGDAELPSRTQQWEGLKQLQAECAAMRSELSDLWRRLSQKTEVA